MTGIDQARIQVLLVEDNPGDVRLLRELLQQYGAGRYEVIDQPSTQAAIKHLSAARPDVVLLDLRLPDAHELEAVRKVRAVDPNLPLVVLTGVDDEALALKALQEGAQDYLVKARLESRSLERALRYAIERKAAEQKSAVAPRWPR